MAKITTDFLGTETEAVTKTRLTDILTAWQYDPSAYTTWGNARTDMNELLTGSSVGAIAASERAGDFLPKINFLNDPEAAKLDAFTGDIDGFALDFTQDDALFASGGVAVPGDSLVTVLDQSEGLVLGPELVTNASGIVFRDATTSVDYTPGVSLVAQKSYLIEYVISENVSVISAGWRINSNGNLVVAPAVAAGFNGPVSTVIKALASGSLGLFGNNTGTDFSISGVTIREIAGTHSAQPSAALQGKVGKAPKVVRNLLTQTEQFDNAVWTKNLVTVSADAAVAPDGTTTADKIIATSASGTHSVRLNTSFSSGLGFYTASAFFKEGDYRYAWIADTAFSRFRVAFDLQELTVTQSVGSAVIGFVSASITDEGDGWRRCSAVLERLTTDNAGVGFSGASVGTAVTLNGPIFTGDDVSGTFIWGAQLEVGSTVTAYQAVGESNLDVTESGVTSYTFYRPDLSDDVLPLTVPAIDGDILIAGGRGIWIEPAAPSAGAFNIGPTTYTGGTPGILRAVCGSASDARLCGVELIDKTLSAAERERLIRYYQSRGAKGLLVPGPNLITNSTFEGAVAGTPGTIPTSWGFNSSGGSITEAVGGVIGFSATDARQIIGQSRTIQANTREDWSVTVVENSGLSFSQLFIAVGTSLITFYINGGDPVPGTEIPADGDILTMVIIAGSTPISSTYRIGVGASGNGTGSAKFSNPTIKRYAPEEDW